MRLIGLILIFLSTGLCANAQSAFDRKIAEALKIMKCAEPSDETPVTLNAGLLHDKDSTAVILKVQMAPGWHIYQYVPASMPYISIDQILKLPEGISAVGKWIGSTPFPSAHDKGVLIFENDAWFVHKLIKTAPVKPGMVIQAGLYYQTCDLRQCLPPIEQVVELGMK